MHLGGDGGGGGCVYALRVLCIEHMCVCSIGCAKHATRFLKELMKESCQPIE